MCENTLGIVFGMQLNGNNTSSFTWIENVFEYQNYNGKLINIELTPAVLRGIGVTLNTKGGSKWPSQNIVSRN